MNAKGSGLEAGREEGTWDGQRNTGQAVGGEGESVSRCFPALTSGILGRMALRWRVTYPRLSLLQFSSVAQSCLTLCNPWTAALQASLSITNFQSSPKPMSIESVMPSNHLILCHPLLLPPSIFPSISFFFKWVSSSHQVAKVLDLQLQHQSFQWTFRIDFL